MTLAAASFTPSANWMMATILATKPTISAILAVLGLFYPTNIFLALHNVGHQHSVGSVAARTKETAGE